MKVIFIATIAILTPLIPAHGGTSTPPLSGEPSARSTTNVVRFAQAPPQKPNVQPQPKIVFPKATLVRPKNVAPKVVQPKVVSPKPAVIQPTVAAPKVKQRTVVSPKSKVVQPKVVSPKPAVIQPMVAAPKLEQPTVPPSTTAAQDIKITLPPVQLNMQPPGQSTAAPSNQSIPLATTDRTIATTLSADGATGDPTAMLGRKLNPGVLTTSVLKTGEEAGSARPLSGYSKTNSYYTAPGTTTQFQYWCSPAECVPLPVGVDISERYTYKPPVKVDPLSDAPRQIQTVVPWDTKESTHPQAVNPPPAAVLKDQYQYQYQIYQGD